MATSILQIRFVPIEVFWRALDLHGEPRLDTVAACHAALQKAETEGEIDDSAPLEFTPFAQALAEAMSGCGAFAPDGGEFESSGYQIKLPSSEP